MSIYIFSRPVHSGKTTELMQWSSRQSNIAGILMPDIDGSRKMYDLGTKDIFDIQCVNQSKTNKPLTIVGRFCFYTSVFEKGNLIIEQALTQNPDWIIIDEAGKLELQGKGFYSGVMKAIGHFQHTKTSGNLVITVRAELCEDIISSFGIKEPVVIHNLDKLS